MNNALMPFANDSKSEDQETLTEFLFAAVLTEVIRQELPLVSALNILLSIAAFFGNATVPLALSKVSTLHPPSKLACRSLTSLAATDLCVSVL